MTRHEAEDKAIILFAFGVLLTLLVWGLLSGCSQPTDTTTQTAPAEDTEDTGDDRNTDESDETTESEPSGEPNEAPRVEIIAPAELENGTSATIEANVTDPDDSVHAYRWKINGHLVTYAPTMTFRREPDMEQTYTVSVTVHDGEAKATAHADITVLDPPWRPKPGHIYTFPAGVTEYTADLIREQWYRDTEAAYYDLLRRVESTVEGHNMNHPDDQLQVVGGGPP
jgi:cytoskeletal protein RodZ